MSKIGKQPIIIPAGVIVNLEKNIINVKGPKGDGSFDIPQGVDVKVDGGEITVSIKVADKKHLSLWGTTRALIANLVLGVTDGFSKQLELVGTGYRAEVAGSDLILTVGFSHPVKISSQEKVTFNVEKNIITVNGNNKETVGQISADIRAVRPPEPYKGKGIKYIDEIVRRKAGKAAKATGTA